MKARERSYWNITNNNHNFITESLIAKITEMINTVVVMMMMTEKRNMEKRKKLWDRKGDDEDDEVDVVEEEPKRMRPPWLRRLWIRNT